MVQRKQTFLAHVIHIKTLQTTILDRLNNKPAPDWDIFHGTTEWGRLFGDAPPISETTRPIFKIQTAFDSTGKFIEKNLLSLASWSLMTSQVRSN